MAASAEAADNSAGFTCEVTGFEGFQEEILRLRNANRERPETLAYLSWRYRSTADAPEPRVFWLLEPGGRRVGMAAVIFRPYRINEERVPTAVVGDISLDAGLRGRGLGRLLLRYMTEYLDRHFPAQPAFVIPTESARRSLEGIGWATSGRLVPHVYVLDASRYLQAVVRSARLARFIARWLTMTARALMRARAPADGVLFLGSTLDGAVAEFMNNQPCQPGVFHDLRAESLNWRYIEHPHIRFTIGRYLSSGEIRGVAVFEDDPLTGTCSVYDICAQTAADVRGMLALLVLRGMSSELSSVRIVVSDRHPLKRYLLSSGFIPRRADSVFQVHSRSGSAERAAWGVTHGDKDT